MTGAERTLRGAEWFIFIVLLLCYTYFLPRWADWNVNSRMNVALAVVEQGTLSIDAYHQNTGDYAFFEGHYYSDKAPATSFLATLVYAPYQFLGGDALADRIAQRLDTNSRLANTLDPNGRGLIRDSVRYFAALVVATFFVSAIPSALLGVLLYRLVRLWARQPTDALLVALAYGLATPAFAYANNLYGHQLAAFLLVAAFSSVYMGTRGARKNWYLALAGFTLGLALITEYPTALIVGGIGLYAIYKLRSVRAMAVMMLGGLPPVVLAAAYNLAIFHTPLPVGYLYSTLYTDVHHIGFISLTYPKFDTLYELLFGTQRGLFLLSPFLLLALPGFFLFARAKQWRAEFWLCLWACVSFFLFNSSSAMWQGGFAVGPRYLLPMFPFLVMPIIFVLNWVRTRWLRAVMYGLGALSLLLVWIETLGGQSFPRYEHNPLLQYSIPEWLRGNIARSFGTLVGLHDVWALLPLAIFIVIVCGVFVWLQRAPARAIPVSPAQTSGAPSR
jgi:hypothetical protein